MPLLGSGMEINMKRLPSSLLKDFSEWIKQWGLYNGKYDDNGIRDLMFDDKYKEIFTKKAEEYCQQYLNPNTLINDLKIYYQKQDVSYQLIREDNFVEIDFLEWLEKESTRRGFVEKVDLMPVEVFEEYAYRFCKDTGRKVETKQKLVKRFKKSEPGSLLKKLDQLLPCNSAYRKKNFRYVYQRYLADDEPYKCVLLPIEEDYPMFHKLVTRRWKDLNDLSADYLDVYYCFMKYGESGYDLVKQLHYLSEKVYAKLPCIVLWKKNLDEALCISIDELSVNDVYCLIREIVDLIIQGKKLDEIVEGANDMGNERRNKYRSITNYNLNANGANNVNQAVVAGDGNIISQSTLKGENDHFIKELDQAIDIVTQSELSEEQKKILINIFEDAKKKDKQKGAKERFSAAIAFAGDMAAKLIDLFAGLVTVATFFGLDVH